MFQALGHLIEGAGKLTQFVSPAGHARARAEIARAQPRAGFYQAPNRADDQELAANPAEQENKAGGNPQPGQVFDQSAVRFGKEDLSGDTQYADHVSSHERTAGGREVIKDGNTLRAHYLHDTAFSSQEGLEKRPFWQGFANNPLFWRGITHEDRAIAIDFGPGGPLRQLHLERIIRTVDPIQIQRGKNDGLDLSRGIENRIAQIEAGLAANAADLVVANGQGTRGKRALEE